ncbi:Metallothionein-like protein type 3 [Ananas comosus]|uniref:Metallothionein-like protein type 3 n=1 Tax=Ananas comosus TaxID=4615 RepID=A0A199W673_ANACO|nr:Metallothionein-like protein type 3 [Ananas comosus]
MSDTCGNCDCADKSQCVKKGNGYGVVIVDTEKSYFEDVAEFAASAEHNGKCKCGASCTCVDCACGN